MFTSDGISHGPIAIKAAAGYMVEPMSVELIHEVADSYGKGAAVAKLAGFQMVTLHAGHGWLVNQFLSPLTNKRTDEYGGSFENRCRFMLEVIESIRKHCGPDFPIEVRMSGTELADELGGYDLAGGVEIAKVLSIDPKTLRKHFAQELEVGHVEANAKVAASLYRRATGEGREAVIAGIFWLKCRAGWREQDKRDADERARERASSVSGKGQATSEADAAEARKWESLLRQIFSGLPSPTGSGRAWAWAAGHLT